MIRPHPNIETRYTADGSSYVLPWWTRPSLEWLVEQPVASWSVLEWGCGLSSVWFNQAAHRYVGIESNPAHAIAPGITVVQTPPRPGVTNDVIDAEVESSPIRSKYVMEGVKHGRAFNLVVVDGIFRRGCFKVAPGLIIPGGHLVVDNANWFDDVVATIRPLFRSYHRFIEPGRDPEWATDVYSDRIEF